MNEWIKEGEKERKKERERKERERKKETMNEWMNERGRKRKEHTINKKWIFSLKVRLLWWMDSNAGLDSP
jgi:hypothetical protein